MTGGGRDGIKEAVRLDMDPKYGSDFAKYRQGTANGMEEERVQRAGECGRAESSRQSKSC